MRRAERRESCSLDLYPRVPPFQVVVLCAPLKSEILKLEPYDLLRILPVQFKLNSLKSQSKTITKSVWSTRVSINEIHSSSAFLLSFTWMIAKYDRHCLVCVLYYWCLMYSLCVMWSFFVLSCKVRATLEIELTFDYLFYSFVIEFRRGCWSLIGCCDSIKTFLIIKNYFL